VLEHPALEYKKVIVQTKQKNYKKEHLQKTKCDVSCHFACLIFNWENLLKCLKVNFIPSVNFMS